MNKTFYITILILVLTSCYKDLGNYDYDNSVTDIPVGLQSTYVVKKQPELFTYTIKPAINIPDEAKKHLTYEWYMSTTDARLKGELVGTDSILTVTMNPKEPDMPYSYYIRLYVKDGKTGAVNMQATTLEVAKPYSYAWMILHETDGHAELGAVEYSKGTVFVTPDAYTHDHKIPLKGKPLNLSFRQREMNNIYWKYNAQTQLYLTTTNPDESGLIDVANNFELYSAWSRMMYPTQRDAWFDASNVIFSGGANGAIMTSKGKVFQSALSGAALYMMSKSSAVTGDYAISKLVCGPQAGIGYDSIGHRFLDLPLTSGEAWYDMIADDPDYIETTSVSLIPNHKDNAQDPSKIPAERQLVALVNGYHYDKTNIAPWQRYTIYAYMISETRSYVYVFHCRGLTNATEPALPYYYEFDTPLGITVNTPMTSGSSYNNILFYAVGNKVYKLDVSNGQSVVIYEHPDPEARIADLKIACEGYCFGDTNDSKGIDGYGFPYNRQLGAAFNLPDGKGEFVVLHLGVNGRVSDELSLYPSVQVYKGFGLMKSIAFI